MIRAETPTAMYIKWMREFPDAPLIRYRTFANTEVLLCNSVAAHQDVLHTHCYSFKKTDLWRRMTGQITGHGIITMEFAEHRAHRKMLNPYVSTGNVRKLEPIFRRKAEELGRLFRRAIAAGPDGTGVIHCTELLARATLDIMGVTSLGQDLRLLTSDHDEPGRYTFHKAYGAIFSPGNLGKVLLFANGFVPTRWIPLQANRDFLYATSWLRSMLTKIVRDRYRELRDEKRESESSASSRDLLTMIVEEDRVGGAAEGISENDIVGHLLQFMAAGHETSANTMAWCIYVMATKPDVQDRLRQETEKLTTQNPHPSFADIDALPYLNNFLRETLRIYAPATTTHRQADVDTVIDGVPIPKGTLLDIIPHVTAMNPRIWGDDVEAFDPDRWDRLADAALNPYSFNVFSNGTRICAGRAFAYEEMKIFLVELVRNFRFLGVEKDYVLENPSFTLQPCGLEVRIGPA
ncbi:cytochrome P450 [Biscogniauxia mediterranea]|nr:cytochrome P450 [Biscogniauxia mediterranea]